MDWHVHLDCEEGPEYENDHKYTITQNPKEPGWRTDSGYDGYGLPKQLAQWICDTLNEHGKDCPYIMCGRWWNKNELDSRGK